MNPSLGLASGTVVVVPYDPQWPNLFEREAARLTASIAPQLLVLEHTGSTAVPGLAAKPVLDILAGYHESGLLPALIAALKASGYDHRGPQGIPEREFFRRGQPRSYHIHLTLVGSAFWKEHLAFRDLLRADREIRDAYGGLKMRLAAEHPRDREAYIDGKTAFVRAALARNHL